MRKTTTHARAARRAALIVTAVAAVVLAGCGDDDGTPTPADDGGVTASATLPSPTEETSAVPSPTDEATDGGAGDVDALVAELESCLNDGGIETESEKADLSTYGEQATIDLTFQYDAVTVPGAVTLWVYDSEEVAAKGKKEIDKDLLEGDSETLLRGQVVVDDFGTTLQEPEAAEQGEIVESCTA